MDTWVESGTEVTPFYDSLLGKLMVHGADRPDAVAKMVKALKGTVLAGIPSNLEYLSTIFASEGFHAGLCSHMHKYTYFYTPNLEPKGRKKGKNPLVVCLSSRACMPY